MCFAKGWFASTWILHLCHSSRKLQSQKERAFNKLTSATNSSCSLNHFLNSMCLCHEWKRTFGCNLMACILFGNWSFCVLAWKHKWQLSTHLHIEWATVTRSKNEFDKTMMSIAIFMCTSTVFCSSFWVLWQQTSHWRASQPDNTIYLLNFALDAQDCGNYH